MELLPLLENLVAATRFMASNVVEIDKKSREIADLASKSETSAVTMENKVKAMAGELGALKVHIQDIESMADVLSRNINQIITPFFAAKKAEAEKAEKKEESKPEATPEAEAKPEAEATPETENTENKEKTQDDGEREEMRSQDQEAVNQ